MKISAISPAYFFLIIMTQTGHGRPSRGSRCQGPASTLASTPVPRCRFGAEHDECGGVLRCLRGPGERCGARWEQTYYTSEMRIWSSSCLAFTKKVNAFSKSFFFFIWEQSWRLYWCMVSSCKCFHAPTPALKQCPWHISSVCYRNLPRWASFKKPVYCVHFHEWMK